MTHICIGIISVYSDNLSSSGSSTVYHTEVRSSSVELRAVQISTYAHCHYSSTGRVTRRGCDIRGQQSQLQQHHKASVQCMSMVHNEHRDLAHLQPNRIVNHGNLHYMVMVSKLGTRY